MGGGGDFKGTQIRRKCLVELNTIRIKYVLILTLT